MGHPFAHVKSHKAGHKRVAHLLGHKAKGGACKKKARGGSAGDGPDGQHVRHAAEPVQLSAEGHRGKSRFKRGGKVGKPMHVAVINIHPHHPGAAAGVMAGPPGAPPMGPPVGPAPNAGAPAGLPPGLPPRQFNQGGSVHYGAGTGLSRLAEYERMRREGH
jgi:hypothetical protein